MGRQVGGQRFAGRAEVELDAFRQVNGLCGAIHADHLPARNRGGTEGNGPAIPGDPGKVVVTGNTVVDALHRLTGENGRAAALPIEVHPGERIILVTTAAA